MDCYSVLHGFLLQETDLNIVKESKIRREMLDREESLRRARLDASLADGISWGMGEDAIEEAEVCVAVQSE